MKLDDIKHGLSSFWDSVSDGWQHLRQSASSSLTRFKLGIPVHRDHPFRSIVTDFGQHRNQRSR
jgi:HSP20 family protein